MKALVNCILSYEVVDKNTGAVNKGINLYYVSPDVKYDNLNYSGLYPSKISISDNLINSLNLRELSYPFTCQLSIVAKPLPNGKSVSVLDNITDIKPLTLFK